MPSEQTANDLAVNFQQAEKVDQSTVRGMRQNVKLVNADHYASNNNNNSVNERKKVSVKGKQQLRLTFNFIHRVRNFFTNRIFNLAPGVVVGPRSDSEIQDQKAAEQHGYIWDYICNIHNIRDKLRHWIDDFFDLGEVVLKLGWNPTLGKPYAGPVQQEMEQTIDEFGNITEVPLGEPFQEMVVPGDVEYERIFAFDLFRDPAAKSMDEARYFIIRKLVDKKELAKQYPDADVERMAEDNYDDTFVVFNATNGAYEKTKNDQVLIMEHFYKPCLAYPDGYYYIATKHDILAQGKLPGGRFPIIWRGFDEAQTSARAFSLIRQIKSPQAEINRCLSKIAEHHISLGDDTVFVQRGTKVAPGGYINGQKVVKHTGPQPMVVGGRSGEQYADHLLRMVNWIERIAGIDLFDEKAGGQDAWAQVHKGLKEKEKFSKYGEKIESMLKEVCEMSLELYKENAPDELLIRIFGRKEIPNLAEFRSIENLAYQIKVDPGNKDADEQMREQLVANTILQYSPEMPSEQRALLIRNMPLGGNNEDFEQESLAKYDQAKNLALAIERTGEPLPKVNYYVDKDYIKDYLVTRRTRPEMQFLPQEIIQRYDTLIQELEQLKAEEVQKTQAMNADFIPTGGDEIKVDIYEEVPASNGGTKSGRATIKTETWYWMKDRLRQQGSLRGGLAASNDADVSNISDLMDNQA